MQALVMFFLHLYDYGTFIAEIFWGLWLFPFGLLVYKSQFIPKIFGILIIIAGFGYPVISFTYLLIPQYGGEVARYALIPSAIGELSIIFWLLIRGVKTKQPEINT